MSESKSAATTLAEYFGVERPLYEAFTCNIQELVKNLLADQEVDYFTIEGRPKTVESLKAKLERPEKAGKYSALSDITDLAGVRVIAYLQEDCERICNIISENFEIDIENTVDKEMGLDPDKFGYLSTHYVASYKDDRISLPEFKKFENLKAEIQVRTLLQHTWAAIDWKLRYKTTSEAPKELQRRLYRISALLEAADDEFSFVSARILAIKMHYREEIMKGHLGIPINKESLSSFLEASDLVKELVSFCRKNGFNVVDPGSKERLDNMLLTTQEFGSNNISDVDMQIRTKLELVKQRILHVKGGLQPGGLLGKISIAPSGVVRLAFMLSCSKTAGKKLLKKAPFSGPFQVAATSALS